MPGIRQVAALPGISDPLAVVVAHSQIRPESLADWHIPLRAVRMVAEIRDQHESEWTAVGAVAELLGIGTSEMVRKWVRQAQFDAGDRAGVTSEESVEVKRRARLW